MEITSTEAQNNFGRYLKLAWFEDIVITKNGKKAAVIKRYEETGNKAAVVAEKAEPYIWGQEKITYEDFLKLSEASENRYEFIDGEVYLLSSPSYEHQRIIMEISYAMYNYFKGSRCRPLTSPFDVTLISEGNKNVVQPDILVICDTENIDEKGRHTGTPALVAEVLSESTQKKDLLKKLNLYLGAGISEYWIVNPARREVYVYCFAEGDIKEYLVFQGSQSVNSMSFKGLAVPLAQLFADS
jgi:prevent-host-death family protein